MRDDRPYDGYLIAFEGPDGAGRYEALELVRGALQARGQLVTVTRPLGPTLAGEIYQEAKLFNELSPRTLSLLTASDLSERLEWEILPALDAGKVVLADRYVYRIIQGLARDLDPSWVDVLNGFAPPPDLVFHFSRPPEELAAGLKLSTLDLYEAGMDIGITRDVPLSYQLYQERLLQEYEHWSREHEMELIREASSHQIVKRVEDLLGLGPGDLDLRRHGVLELMLRHESDPAHVTHIAELAVSLFDQTVALHKLGNDKRELLEMAALLQDLTLEDDHRDRHVKLARTIRESQLPGFTGMQLEELAILAASAQMSHERELDSWLLSLPADSRPAVRLLAPLARLAEAFNASRIYTTRWINVTLDDDRCIIKMQTRNKAKAELRAIADKSDLFQKVYGLTVSASSERQGPPPANADLTPTMPHAFCQLYR